jgi:SNF2 family DNA or RNA helicase
MGNATLDLRGNLLVLDTQGQVLGGLARVKLSGIGGVFSDDGTVAFKIDPNNQEAIDDVYDSIQRVLGSLGESFETVGEAAEALNRRLIEEARFREFSQEAFNIRNNIDVADGLREFTDVIQERMIRKPYELQLLSAYHLAFSQNACNFSVPGTGKTTVVYTSYCYLNSFPERIDKFVDKLLIICPPAAFGPWEDEYEQCFGRKPSIRQLINLSAEERSKHYKGFTEAEITMISFQSAANDKDGLKYFLEDNPNTMVVIDEAHNIKNTSLEAKWSNAILSLADGAKARVCLTGTPAPNDPSDLWNLYKFIWPHKKIISFPLQYLADLQFHREKQQLIDDISPFFVRVRKSDLGLPEPVFNAPSLLPMDDAQKHLYDYINGPTIESIENELDASQYSNVLRDAKMIRLMQCASNPHLLKRPLLKEQYSAINSGLIDAEIMEQALSYDKTPPKFMALLGLVEQITSQKGPAGKVIIWSIFVDNIRMISDFLAENGINSQLLYGEVPTGNDETDEDIVTRQRIVREFHDEQCPYKVLIANPAAVGESISLHLACHNAIYFEKDFNAARYMQSKDRIHRYGLSAGDKIQYFSLLSDNSIDLDIHERVLEKERVMLEIIEKEEIPLFSAQMSKEESAKDLMAVLRGYHARNFS